MYMGQKRWVACMFTIELVNASEFLICHGIKEFGSVFRVCGDKAFIIKCIAPLSYGCKVIGCMISCILELMRIPSFRTGDSNYFISFFISLFYWKYLKTH